MSVSRYRMMNCDVVTLELKFVTHSELSMTNPRGLFEKYSLSYFLDRFLGSHKYSCEWFYYLYLSKSCFPPNFSLLFPQTDL